MIICYPLYGYTSIKHKSKKSFRANMEIATENDIRDFK